MTTALTTLRDTFLRTFDDGIGRLDELLPQLVLAVLALIGGWLIAAILYHVTVRTLNLLAVDKIIGKTPLHTVLREFGARRSPSDIIGRAIFWIAILLTLLLVSDLLEIEPLTRGLTLVIGYVPQIIAAFVILLLGMLVARALQILVTQAIGRMGFGYERAAGHAVHVVILAASLLIASQQLGFDLTFLTTNISIIVSCALLTVGLAVALGARSLVENALLLRNVQKQLRTGDRIEAGHLRGTVSAFTATGVVLRDQERTIVVPASTLALQPFSILGRNDVPSPA